MTDKKPNQKITSLPDGSKTLPPASETRPVKGKDGDSDSFLNAILWAAVIALVVRTFLFEPFSIPSESMYPTLKVGDYLFVKKYEYGYGKYSFPFGLAEFDGRIMESTPERGDIVVFRKPYAEHIDYIKRVIGLPGDTVKMTDGQLFINGERVPRDFIGMDTVNERGFLQTYHRYIESLPDGPQHYMYEINDEGPLDFTPRFTVPEGYFFAMGDNRDESQDSRVIADVGFIPVENLVGKAAFFFFSFEPIGDECLKSGSWETVRRIGCIIGEIPSHIRYERLLRPVHRGVQQ